MLTTRLPGGAVIQVARPLGEVNATLRDAAARARRDRRCSASPAALALARLATRAAVKPVAELTEAAEHVARTRDLTRRIEREGDDELSRLAGAFNTMLEALDDSQRAQRRLVADASHELRTPLTSLRTNLEVLARGGLAPADHERLRADLIAQLEELTLLVSDLVDLAREEEPAAELEALALDELVAAAVERARAARARRRVRRRDLEPTLVEGVRGRLDRAVANLLDNAAKHGDGARGGDAPRRGADACATTGRASPRRTCRSSSTASTVAAAARAGRAPGLGLAIVRQAAEAHGGARARRARRPAAARELRARPARVQQPPSSGSAASQAARGWMGGMRIQITALARRRGALARAPAEATRSTPRRPPATRPDASTRQAMADFAQCMRENGIDLPDPGSGERGRGARSRAARRRCARPRRRARSTARRSSRPSSPTSSRRSSRRRALAHARCMREHGIENFPDPQFDADGGASDPVRAGRRASTSRTPTSRRRRRSASGELPGSCARSRRREPRADRGRRRAWPSPSPSPAPSPLGGGDGAPPAAAAAAAGRRDRAPSSARDLVERDSLDGTLGYADDAGARRRRGRHAHPPARPGRDRPPRASRCTPSTACGRVAALRRAAGVARLHARDGGRRGRPPARAQPARARRRSRTATSTVDDEWDWATTAAVERFQEERGLDETGTLTRGQVLFRPRRGADRRGAGDRRRRRSRPGQQRSAASPPPGAR